MQKEAASLPRHQGVLEPTLWTFLFGTGGDQGLRLWRARTERTLVSGECFLSCGASLGEPYPAEQLDTLWHNLLRAYSHAQTVLFTQDYADHFDLVKKTFYSARDLRGQALQKIAGRVKVRQDRPCVLLFNNLPWDRTEVVQIWATMPPGGATNIVVRNTRGETLPHQVIDANFYRRSTTGGPFKELNLLIEARVPAMGYTTVYVDPAEGTLELPETSSSGNRLDTSFASIEWSARGVEFLLDKLSGARYAGLGNVVYRGYEVVNDFRAGAAKETLRWTNAQLEGAVRGPLRSSFTLKGPLGPHSARLTGHLYPQARRVSFETGIETPGGSGFFVTTAGLPGPGQFTADVHFGVEPRDLSKVAYEGDERTFKNVFYGSHWADYSNERYGLTVLATTGEKGFQFFPQENVLEHFLLKLFPKAAKSWWRFTTPAAEAVGRHSFDYQFLLHSGDWKSGDVVRRAMESRYPILAVSRDHPLPSSGQVLPEEKSFVKLSPATVQLSAFYRQGDRYIARVYECSGTPARASLGLPADVTGAREINFHGEPRGKAVTIGKQSVQFDMAPWEIVTIELA
jgi:alpha-mannosidase